MRVHAGVEPAAFVCIHMHTTLHPTELMDPARFV